MNKILLAILIVLASSTKSLAQSSSSTTSVIAPNTSTTTLEDQKGSLKKKWGGGFDFYGAQDSRLKPDADATLNATTTTARLSYKMDSIYSVSLAQRIFYYQQIDRNYQDAPYIANLRLNLNQKIDLWNAEGTNLFRLTLPTDLIGRRDSAYFGSFTYSPLLTWTLNPKWSVAYNGSFVYSAYLNPKNHSMLVQNIGIINYSLNSKVNLYQSAGHTYGGKDSNMNEPLLENRSVGLNLWESALELSTGADIAVTPNFNLGLSVSQTMPFVESKDLVEGKSIAYLPGTYALYNPDQSIYELNLSYNF